jgi:hypothetical protein
VVDVPSPRRLPVKTPLLVIAMFVASLAAGYPQTQPGPSFTPKDGFVPNAETAVKIAEAVLTPVYGEKQILAERPFQAALAGDVWTVGGTLHCATPNARCNGGTAEVLISKSSGQILHMIHYK